MPVPLPRSRIRRGGPLQSQPVHPEPNQDGHRRISLDQLSSIAQALGTTLNQLVESVGDDDVVIRPQHDAERGTTTWMLSRDPGPHGMTVAKMRVTKPEPRRDTDELAVHPGRDWVHRAVRNHRSVAG